MTMSVRQFSAAPAASATCASPACAASNALEHGLEGLSPSPAIGALLERALSGHALDVTAVATLAALNEHSRDAALTRAAGDMLTRRRSGNRAMLLGQAGVESHPCPADCGFCGFGQSQCAGTSALSDDVLDDLVRQAAAMDNLYAFFLMYMHTYDFERVLRQVRRVRALLPSRQEVVVNMGDFDAVQAAELRAAGADGAYHVLRLREGVDTRLHPADRLRTIDALLGAGLRWYTCCEPIGPEHSPQELAEQILGGPARECFQHAVMRRVPVPGTPLAERGQITSLRFAQLAAVVSLAMAGNATLASIAVHEPDMAALVSGGNCVYAEFGHNPRDRSEDTRQGRGASLAQGQNMLREAGFATFFRQTSVGNAARGRKSIG